jgi:ferredoxin-nitrite reductase
VTIDVPLGDTSSSELTLIADLADRYADGFLVLGRDQDVVLRNVAVESIDDIRAAIAPRGLTLLGEGRTPRIRACTGSSVCALGIAAAPDAGRALLEGSGLSRHASLRVHVSGCPNSCAQHQAGDIGLAGTKVRIGGAVRTGYHVYLGAALDEGRVGQVIGRVADGDVALATDAIVGVWESLRRSGEPLSATVQRIGIDAVAAHLEAVMAERWASGPEPELAPTHEPAASSPQPS